MRGKKTAVRNDSKTKIANYFALSGLCSFHFATPARLQDERNAKRKNEKSKNAPKGAVI